MTDLERVREITKELCNAAFGKDDVEPDKIHGEAERLIDAHLKEDAEREAILESVEEHAREYGAKTEADLARLREENKQLLLTKAGAFKAQMEYAEENARLREALSHHDEREHERLLTELARLRRSAEGWEATALLAERNKADREAELARLREALKEIANTWSPHDYKVKNIARNALKETT